MKSLLIISFVILISFLSANVAIPTFISEIYFEGDDWTIELCDYWQIFGYYPLYNAFLTSSSGTSAFEECLYFLPGETIIVTQDDLVSPLNINKQGDYVLFSAEDIEDEVCFGDYPNSTVNAPFESQSLARMMFYAGPPTYMFWFNLVKESPPTLGYDPFTVNSTGIFCGFIFDSFMNPVNSVEIEYTPWSYNFPEITTNESGYFEASMYGMNYELNIHLSVIVSMDSTVSIEPDSVNYFEFVFENYVVGVEEPEVVIPSQDYHLSNHPNPFNPSTAITFFTAEDAENAELLIYNSKGQKVDELSINNPSNAGQVFQYSITWEADNFPSGVYLYKLIIDGKELAANKMLLLK